MAKKYMVYRNGSITIRGASVDIKIGDLVKESVFRNYPNYIYEVDDETIVEPVKEKETPVEAIEKTVGEVVTEEVVDEPVEAIEETVDEELATETKPKRGKK